MPFSRSFLAGLFAIGLSSDPAFAAPAVYYETLSPAQDCAASMAGPAKTTPSLKRLCETAADDPLLSRADKAATLANAGIASLRLGAFDAALDRLEEARHLDPSNGDIAISLGATLIRLDRAKDAVGVLSDLGRISPDNMHLAYYNRGLAYWALEDAENAYRDFYASAAIRPDFKPAGEALSHFEIVSGE